MSRKYAYILILIGLLLLGFRLFYSPTEIKNLQPAGKTIVCFGDSLTAGYGAAGGKDYPSQLSEMLGQPVINAGVSGDTTALALERLDDDVLSQNPRMVLITLGGNDLRHRISKRAAFGNLKTIVEAIQEQGALVIVGGIDIPFYSRGFGEEYQKLADETGAILIPNIFEDIFGNRRLMSDSIHPNDDGYQIIARRFYNAIPKHLK